jgi:hypothetical protein
MFTRPRTCWQASLASLCARLDVAFNQVLLRGQVFERIVNESRSALQDFPDFPVHGELPVVE